MGERTFTDADRAIEARMNAYWSNFVKRGDPNATGLPRWSAATSTGAIMGLGESWAPIDGPEIARTDFFRAYLEQGGRASLF